MGREIRDRVVVVTGASSGIGRATAHAFAKQGAIVCVTARREDALREVVHECEALGARALAIPADVTQPGALERVARIAVEQFGRLDVWINNAAVTSFGAFDETPPDVFRKVLDTNLLGYVEGARAALLRFKEQRHGVLINNASMVARVGQPFAAAYVASKHAVRGLGQSLRQELKLAGLRDVRVCTVMPASIDTPLFEHAANFTGRAPRAIKPVLPPERVSRAMVRLARRPRREVFVGNPARQIWLLSLFSPRGAERAMAELTQHRQFEDHTPAPRTTGNVFEPVHDGLSVSGGWKSRGNRRLGRTLAVAVAALLLPVVGFAAWRGTGSGQPRWSPDRLRGRWLGGGTWSRLFRKLRGWL